MRIRPATADDLPALMVLEEAGFPVAERWSAQAWRSELAGTDRWVRVGIDQDRVIGVISVQILVPDSDLMRIVVDPRRRREGLATRLVTAAVDHAAAAGASAMMLEVRHDNDAAIACYGRAGFEQLTSRDHYYGQDRHALVMRAWDLGRTEGATS